MSEPPVADETLDESVQERLDASPTMGQPSAGRVLAQASLILTVAAWALNPHRAVAVVILANITTVPEG